MEYRKKLLKSIYTSPEVVVKNVELEQNILAASGKTQSLTDFEGEYW